MDELYVCSFQLALFVVILENPCNSEERFLITWEKVIKRQLWPLSDSSNIGKCNPPYYAHDPFLPCNESIMPGFMEVLFWVQDQIPVSCIAPSDPAQGIIRSTVLSCI